MGCSFLPLERCPLIDFMVAPQRAGREEVYNQRRDRSAWFPMLEVMGGLYMQAWDEDRRKAVENALRVVGLMLGAWRKV